MDLKKRIGQLFVIGYQGLEPTPEVLSFVEEWGIGGVIVFARNIDDPKRIPGVLDRLQKAAGCPIFTSVDQEGGLVLRILSVGSLFPGAMAMSATDDLALVERLHTAMGKEMRALGLNWNLAPVLDINHRDNPGIGARSFGETPERVSRFGSAAITGLRAGGVLACAKHFPGKGDAQVDSHLKLPTIPHSRERLFSHELVPFMAAIEAKVDAIMTSHVFFPAIEPKPDLPGTLSKAVLTDLLRKELKFDGLLITDDLEMGAITESFGVPDASYRSFMAGADLLLICHDLGRQREAAERILKAVETDPVAKARLEESLKRIAVSRARLATSPTSSTLAQLAKEHAPLMAEAHARAILTHRIEEGGFPLDPAKPLVAMCPEIASLVPVEEDQMGDGLGTALRQRFPKAATVSFAPKATADEIVGAFNAYKKAHPGCEKQPLLLLSYNAHLFAGQQEAFERLSKGRSGVVLAAIRNPYDVTAITGPGTAIASFGFRSPALKAMFDTLEGKTDPRLGPWPIEL